MATAADPLPEPVRRRLEALDDDQLESVAGELFGVAGLLDREPALRRALTDRDVPATARRELLGGLLAGRVGPAVVEVLGEVLTAGGVTDSRLPDRVVDLAGEALMTQAKRHLALGRLLDELLATAELLEESPSLNWALRETRHDPRRAAALIDDVLGGRVEARTLRLLDGLVEARRAGRLAEVARELANRAAALQDRVLAEVRTAVALDEERRRRLAEALQRTTGKQVELRCAVDPRVVGSVWVKIGDEVIDGTIRRQLAAAEAALLRND